MSDVEVSVAFGVTPEVAFDYLADPANRPQWQSSLRSVRMLHSENESEGEPGVGTRWVDHTVVGVRPRMETTVHERPRRWVEVGRWRGLSAELGLVFEASGAGSVVRARMRFSGTGVYAPLARVLGLVSGPPVAADLRRAARLLDQRARH